jgi:secreted trypsin-like serine protease
MKKFLAPLLALMTVLSLSASAGAITNGGTLDGDDHPYVGLMVATIDGNPVWRCSGALISPTVYVTAGHCTESPANGALLWFESDLEPDPLEDFGYPFESSITGTTYTHPLYDPGAFFYYDLGLVILDEPVILDEYASLPDVDAVEGLLANKGRKGSTLTAVGYGLQQVSPPSNGMDMTRADKTRYQADLKIVTSKGVAGIGTPNFPDSRSLLVSGDARNGGTCFGDSGGPMLDGNVIMAVTSFGLNPVCAGVGGVYRIDGAVELGWINSITGM